ncbi:MAG: mechanosensitive ion channel family protein [Armatimonadota bacterium]|nr:mechanosensitive ion channel family protein [Armatimonadota bacterium]
MSDKLTGLMFISIRVLFIAIIFEFIAWWLGRRIDKWTAPLIPIDTGREHNWRARRRAALRQTPKIISRALCYTIALLLVFDVFGVPVLPLSIGIGAIALLFGATLLPLLRDAAQGYALLAEDAVAVGDVVEIDGHQGVVERFTLRGILLRDNAQKAHHLSNRDIKSVVVHQRRTEATTPGSSGGTEADGMVARGQPPQRTAR